MSIDTPIIKGVEVEMTPPPGLDVERFYVERMMEVLGIPDLTVKTAPELHRRMLTWTYGPDTPSMDLPAIIGKYLGTTVSVNPLSRAAFNRKARTHLWAKIENYVAHETRDIIHTKE